MAKIPKCGMKKEIQPWGWGCPAELKGHEDGEGFSYCGTPRSPSLGHPSPLDGPGMLHAGSTTNPLGARVLFPSHSPPKCSEVRLFFIPMSRGMTAAAQGGEWEHPDVESSWDTLVDQLSPKIPHLPFMWHPEKDPHGLELPTEEVHCPQAQLEGRRGWQQKHHLLVPIV